MLNLFLLQTPDEIIALLSSPVTFLAYAKDIQIKLYHALNLLYLGNEGTDI